MIRVDLSKCTGCKRCETACAFFHTKKVSNRLARIKVVNIYKSGIDGPVVCVQCQEQYCMECPANALYRGPLGQVMYSPHKCVQCGTCERQCPIGAIELFNETVYVCNLCEGNPQCVKVCTEGAITYRPDEERPSLKDFKNTKNTKMNPSEKRYTYIETQGVAVRKKWRESHG